MRAYVVGRNDCVAYVLQELGLPNIYEFVTQFQISSGCLIANLIKHLHELPRVKRIVFNPKLLVKKDILFMAGKTSPYVHHVAIYQDRNSVKHAIPGKIAGLDWFDRSKFVFGVTLSWV